MDYEYNAYDREAARILDDFLPDRIFDAHAHLYDNAFQPDTVASGGIFAARARRTTADYLADMEPLFTAKRSVRLNLILNPDPSFSTVPENRAKSAEFLVQQLDEYPGNVGEIIVLPGDAQDDILRQLVHPGIRGFKCYHCYARSKVTWDAEIGEYLPESAWEVAEQRRLCITLHMVRDRALSDPANLRYIQTMARRYPNAVLILAHAARSFAAWTAVEAVEQLARYENVWFDFSAVCESPAMTRILQKIGVSRCMWGSDYPVCCLSGKAISLADSFYWIGTEDLARFQGLTAFHSWQIGTENLMAVRQACILADLGSAAVEDLFYRNAMRLFRLEERG